MLGIATVPQDILAFLADDPGAEAGSVLVTLTGIEGSTSRALGAQLAVRADGSYLGSFSGGCIEAAVVAEALAVLAEGRGRTVRYGVGSPFIDIRLPCGGGIDLLFTPRPDLTVLRRVLESLEARQPAALDVAADGIAPEATDSYVCRYLPPLRVLALGQGEDLAAFARLAQRYGLKVECHVPDESMAGEDCAVHRLQQRSAVPELSSDPWTAIVFLFHDHDWEEALLPAALAVPALFIGAVGSPRTQAARSQMLRAKGVSETAIQRLRGPIGLIPATRDPGTLALSILAEVVAVYQAACRSVQG